MASLSKTDSKRMYSWWWNSHISPKNSKWLQENLTDVDIKVKAMIKLIEEDADSFARRAEMYYKKRPELMKLVEEMYRAYRALAERYVHATGALRQAHKTMTEAFPNQVPVMGDDPSANSPYDGDPQTPDSRTTFDPNDEDSDGSVITVRRGLKFGDSEDGSNKNRSRDRGVSEFENTGMTDKEILLLKAALAKLEEEKESGLKQYQESLERLSKLESEISHAQEASSELADRASKAESEAQSLKDALQRLKAETGDNLELYHRGLEKLANLERMLIEQAKEGERVIGDLKEEIRRLKEENDAAYDQYKQSMETQSELEKKLAESEKDGMEFRERAEKAESEVENLKVEIVKLTEEKEEQAKLYQKCLETISSLELRLACAEEESERLNNEIGNGVLKLKGVEEQCLMLEKSNESLHTELESAILKMNTQTQELTEKQKELGRLWTCIQEERLRFVEAETAFQTLQQLHSQSQEELRSLATDLHNKAQILRDIETRNQVLEREIQKQIEENKNLTEVNLSSIVSMKDMQSQIGSLKDSNVKLTEEVDLRVDQRNALQQEIYCLKEEINELNKTHQSILNQVADVGLDPEILGASVKELQDENSNLKQNWETEKSEKADLLVKLEIMSQLLEKNAVLENSLSDLGEELEGVRSKLKALEDSYESLSEEKSSLAVEKANLLGQLQVTSDNLSIVSEKNTVLENSLFDAHVKLEVLKQKSKSFEDSCQLLADEKSVLITENGILVSQMETTEKNLKDLEVKYTDLQDKYSSMEKERDSTLHKVEELHASLALQNQQHVAFSQKNENQLNTMRTQIQFLEEENRERSKEFEEEFDKAFGSEIEIFVLLKCVQDLEENNVSLLNDCHKLQEAVKLSESLVHVLKQEKIDSQEKIESLSNQNNKLKMGMHQLLEVAGLSLHSGFENDQHEKSFDIVQRKFEGTNRDLIENQDKNTELGVQISILVTLLKQLKTTVADLEAEKSGVQHELRVGMAKILELETEARKLSETNESLRSKLSEGDVIEDNLRTQLENLQLELSVVQEAYRSLQVDNSVVLAENKSLLKDNVHMNNKICLLEDENDAIFGDVISQSILSHTLKTYLDEKHEEVNGLGGDLQKLLGVNSMLADKISMVEKNLEDSRTENVHLKENLEKSERELESVISVRDRLDSELITGISLLRLKEKEHEDAVQKVMILENEKTGLSEILAGLQRENEEVKMTRDEQGKQIVKLLEDNDDLKDSLDVKNEEINRLGEDLEKLLVVNNTLADKMSIVEKKLEDSITENLHLKEDLEKSEREMETVKSDRDRLDSELVNGINLLHLKEKEHEEAVQKLMILENDKTGLSEMFSSLEREHNEVKMTKDEHGKQIGKLLEDNDSLKNSLDEKHEEINRLGEDLQKLLVVNNTLANEIGMVEKKLEDVRTENLQLKQNLEKSEQELETLARVRDQLDSELANRNNLLLVKEKELEDAVEKLMVLENDKMVLSEMLAGLQIENHEVKTMKEEQGKQITKLLEETDDLSKERKLLREASRLLEVKLHELTEEHEKTKQEEETLSSELQKEKDRTRLLETEASEAYGDLQASGLYQVLLEEKIRELTQVCLSLQEETNSKDAKTELLKEKTETLESENEDLKARLAVYLPALVSLKDRILSLESHTCIKTKVPESENEEEKDAESSTMEVDPFVELQDLENKVRSIETAVLEMQMLAVQDKLDSDAKLESAMKQIEELSYQKSSRKSNGKPKSTSEISEVEIGILPKDIMLDQASECSSYGVSKRGLIEGEAWETPDKNNVFRHHPTASEVSLETLESESNMAMDKPEVSKRFREPRDDGNKRKVLERLNSDVQKLTNLQITIEDLKRKVEITGNSRRGKSMIECETLKGQLMEAESAIQKLYELNGKLVKHVEGTSSTELGESESMRRKKVSEQARRVSEKIGRLQLEVQKIQFVLLKLDDENDPKGKTRFMDTKKRVLLKDYLYGGGRTKATVSSSGRRKKNFCACVEPSTKGD
ncbi:hypothetical protein L1887_05973 [Cichorium endivia]|nr:hypothetical protein L1887_05973 [Cichorium endivia]